MILSGSVHTLHFYSHPIHAVVSEKQIYINWNDFKSMTGTRTEIAPHRLNSVPGGDEVYVSLAYLDTDMLAFVNGTLLGALVDSEFCNYVIKEMVVNMVIPAVELSYAEYETGVFETPFAQYILPHVVTDMLQSKTARIPDDVVRVPTAIIVEDGPEGFFMFPTWLIELSSLPYILSQNRKKPFHTSNLSEETRVSIARVLLEDGE